MPGLSHLGRFSEPALLILDIGLPDASGWEVARWLEQITDPVPIIIISGLPPEAKQLRRFHPAFVDGLPTPRTNLVACSSYAGGMPCRAYRSFRRSSQPRRPTRQSPMPHSIQENTTMPVSSAPESSA